MTKPQITISHTDHERLTHMANGLLERKPELADELLTELERARVLKSGAALRESAQMGSTLEYETEDGQTRRVTLVYPADADIAEGRISVLTPIGTALLGLRAGKSIGWTANDGRTHRLTLHKVSPSGEAD
jgi:regulator of nucleoside diphosphate kinase